MTDVDAGFGGRHLTATGGTYYPEEAPAPGTVTRVNAGGPAPGQSNKSYTGSTSIATGGTVALETVAASKTLYITDITVYANTAVVFTVDIQAAGVTIWQGYCKGDTGPIQCPGVETQPTATAGQAVQVVFGTAAATTTRWNISGVEQ